MRAVPLLGALAAAIACTVVASPMNAQATAKPTAQSVCKDGTTSTAKGRGACSGHGGVDSLATVAAQKEAKAAKARAAASKVSGDSVQAAAADSKAKRAEAKAAKAEDKAAHDSTGAIAQCKDNTYSHAKTMQGGCAKHGGVLRRMRGGTG